MAGRGISKAEGDLASKVQSYGPEAIPYLIELLEDENQGVRQLAGYTIRDIAGLASDHLAPLIKARENGDRWIPPAIARIGTREAIEFLANDLRRNPGSNTQVTYAFKILGPKGAPYIADLYACTDDCNERVFDAASFVLGEIGEDAVAVIPKLLAIAKDERLAPVSRQHAVIGIGQIGTSAASFVPELIALRENEPLLATYIDHALVNIGSSEAVASLLRALPDDAVNVLSDIKRLGENGYEAGPAVLAYLDADEEHIRVLVDRIEGISGHGEVVVGSLAHDDDIPRCIHAQSDHDAAPIEVGC